MNYLIEISVEQETLWWICGGLYFLLALPAMRIFAHCFKRESNWLFTETDRREEAITCGVLLGIVWPFSLLVMGTILIAAFIVYVIVLGFRYTVFRGFK